MQLSSLPAKIAAIFAASAAPTSKNTIPLTQAGILQPGQASFDVGFPAVTMQPAASGGLNPYGQDFNGILNAVTAVEMWQSAGGFFPYDATFASSVGGYPKGSILSRVAGTGFWLCTTDNNSTNPETGGAGWITFAADWTTGVDTGAANAALVNYTPVVTTLVDGMVLWFKAAAANTGATTLNVNGLGAKPVVGGAHAALQGGEIVVNGKCQVVYNATLSSFVLIECSGAALQIAPGTQSQHALQLGQATGRFIARRVFTSTQIYTPTPGTNFVDVLVQGAGGGGGGSQSTGVAQAASGAGGGGGGFAKKRITSGFSGVTITLGQGGAGGVTTANGVAGGTSSFGALVSATGGSGGSYGPQQSVASSVSYTLGFANSGIGSLGDFNGRGGWGGWAFYATNPQSGKGGSSYFGEGGLWVTGYATGGNADVYGGGGAGANSPPSQGGATGGAGYQGVVIVEEYS
jgi:hypothetical protein